MFRSFITNLVLQACLVVALVLGINSKMDYGRELFLLGLASICILSSTVYAILRKRFWRIEKRLHDIAPSLFAFGMIVAHVMSVRLAVAHPLEEEMMLGSLTFCLMVGLAVLTWRFQRLRSLPTLLWMVGYGAMLSALANYQDWLFGAVALYGICLTAICLFGLIAFLLGFLGSDPQISPQYRAEGSSSLDDGIPARGYGSSHV